MCLHLVGWPRWMAQLWRSWGEFHRQKNQGRPLAQLSRTSSPCSVDIIDI